MLFKSFIVASLEHNLFHILLEERKDKGPAISVREPKPRQRLQRKNKNPQQSAARQTENKNKSLGPHCLVFLIATSLFLPVIVWMQRSLSALLQ